MAPNFKKVKVFGKRDFRNPVPLNTDDPDQRDLESGQFLGNRPTAPGSSSATATNGSDNPYMDEYSAYV